MSGLLWLHHISQAMLMPLHCVAVRTVMPAPEVEVWSSLSGSPLPAHLFFLLSAFDTLGIWPVPLVAESLCRDGSCT